MSGAAGLGATKMQREGILQAACCIAVGVSEHETGAQTTAVASARAIVMIGPPNYACGGYQDEYTSAGSVGRLK